MASRNDARCFVDWLDNWINHCKYVFMYKIAMSGLSKLWSPQSEILIISLLLGALTWLATVIQYGRLVRDDIWMGNYVCVVNKVSVKMPLKIYALIMYFLKNK